MALPEAKKTFATQLFIQFELTIRPFLIRPVPNSGHTPQNFSS